MKVMRCCDNTYKIGSIINRKGGVSNKLSPPLTVFNKNLFYLYTEKIKEYKNETGIDIKKCIRYWWKTICL